MQKLEDLQIPICRMLIDDGRPTYSFQLFIAYWEILEKTEYGKATLQRLTNDPRVNDLKGALINNGNQRFSVTPTALAMWFIWYAMQKGEKAAHEALDQWFTADTHEIQHTLWVVGLELVQGLQLPNGISITPIDDLPESDEKEDYLTVSRDRMGAQHKRLPACAITKKVSIQKISSGIGGKDDAYFAEHQKHTQQLFDVAALLNVLHGVICVPYCHISYVLEPQPLCFFTGRGSSSPVIDVSTDAWGNLTPDSLATLTHLVASFEKRTEKEKEKLRVILSRLSQAKRRSQATDKVLDLGIALEMLLLDEAKNDQISLIFRLRGSWLLGESPADREKKYDLLNSLYGARSAVAHNGALPRKSKAGIHAENFLETFPQYETLASDIAQKIILHGWPNWKSLVLGGE